MKTFLIATSKPIVFVNLKWLLILLFFCAKSAIGFSIVEYEINDTLYNWSEYGLNLRDQPDLNSRIIIKLEFGQEIICLERKTRYEYNANSSSIIEKLISRNPEKKTAEVTLKGTWIKVKFGEFIGYVFDAYLSKLKTPKSSQSGVGFKSYLVKECEVLNFLNKKDSLSEWGVDKIVFENGFHLTIYYSSGGGGLKLIAPDYSAEEAILLVHCLGPFWSNIAILENAEICIGDSEYVYRIRTFENVVIIEAEWGC